MGPHNQFSQLRLGPGVARRVGLPPSSLLSGTLLSYAHPILAPTAQFFRDFLSVPSPGSPCGEGQAWSSQLLPAQHRAWHIANS